MKHDITHALTALRPNTSWILTGDSLDGLEWVGPGDPPTLEELQAKIAEMDALEPMRLLRLERDRRLAETDWWAVADRTMTDAQREYRQALRDITDTANPTLDSRYQLDLNSVSWPVRP
jgi:hypothetical protein